MTAEGEKIHALWKCMVALYVVLGKMTRGRAETKAYNELVAMYGEETLIKELEIPNAD